MKFIDETKIRVIAGDGGPGCVSFHRAKFVRRGPADGGNGGHGGDVVALADGQLTTLLDLRYRKECKASPGKRGADADCHGRRGDDYLIKVPVGTMIRDAATGELLADLKNPGERAIVAAGGRGGKGNAHFASSTNRSPRFAQPGEPGEERELEIELRLLADVGIIGLPNAGKSTLISVISAVRPKIADYPFTTLVPNLGVVRKPTGDGDGTLFADIPGLIEGAHEGLGLGHDFLRHVERTKLLLHLVDGTAADPLADYRTIQQELVAYGRGLAGRPQLLAINKVDALPDEAVAVLASQLALMTGTRVFRISAVSRQGTDELLQALWKLLDETNAALKAAEAQTAQALLDFKTPTFRPPAQI